MRELERRYRQLLRAYPAGYRRARAARSWVRTSTWPDPTAAGHRSSTWWTSWLGVAMSACALPALPTSSPAYASPLF
ncbi:hypothetical protein ACFHW0_22370 [Micromonospora sp. LOL_025]|uniref:hypothetical protein n=1 Tax=Micromonospora sp. LOL_025 TaxID=3345413 RepID=UPI003A87AF10